MLQIPKVAEPFDSGDAVTVHVERVQVRAQRDLQQAAKERHLPSAGQLHSRATLPPRPTTAAASPRPEGPAPRAGCSGAPAPPASSSPLNALVHEAELAGDVAVARHTAASPTRAATSLQTSLASQRRRAVLYGCGTKQALTTSPPQSTLVPAPRPPLPRLAHAQKGAGGAALRSPRGDVWGSGRFLGPMRYSEFTPVVAQSLPRAQGGLAWPCLGRGHRVPEEKRDYLTHGSPGSASSIGSVLARGPASSGSVW